MSTSKTDVGLRPRIQVVKNIPMATSLAVALFAKLSTGQHGKVIF